MAERKKKRERKKREREDDAWIIQGIFWRKLKNTTIIRDSK